MESHAPQHTHINMYISGMLGVGFPCTPCMPTHLQDGIMVEWEEQLPLKEYAIRVPLWMTHKLPDILQVRPELVHALACACAGFSLYGCKNNHTATARSGLQ